MSDTLVAFGSGFEMFFDAQSNFTFCGMPGSMIKFKEGLGEGSDWARSLGALYGFGRVLLMWNELNQAAEYDIFRAEKREGLHNLTMAPVASVPGDVTTWVDMNPFVNSSGVYYMIVAVNGSGVRKSSTYSVGAERVHFEGGIQSIGLMLEPLMREDLETWCNDHSELEGIAYVVSGVWKFHSWAMSQSSYNADLELGSGYQVSVRSFSQFDEVEIGY